MKSNPEAVSFFQTCMMFMLMAGLTSHVIVNSLLLDASGRDAWIAVLAAGACFIPWSLLLVYIMRKSGQQKLQVWLEHQSGRIISWLLIVPLLLQLYLIGLLTVVHTTIWTITNYLPSTPKLALILPLTLACLYCAKTGIRTIAVSAGLLLPTVILLGMFVSISNSSEKNYNLLRPFLENGWMPVLDGMIYAGGGLLEIVMMVTLHHRIRKKVKVWQMVLFCFLMVYITLGPIIGAITEFGPQEAAKQMTSPYEQWRLVKIGDYIEHVDFFSVYQWLAGATVRISLSMFLFADLLPLQSAKKRGLVIWIITISFIVFSMLPINQNTFHLWLYRIYFPASLALTLLLTVVWTALAMKTKPCKEKAT